MSSNVVDCESDFVKPVLVNLDDGKGTGYGDAECLPLWTIDMGNGQRAVRWACTQTGCTYGTAYVAMTCPPGKQPGQEMYSKCPAWWPDWDQRDLWASEDTNKKDFVDGTYGCRDFLHYRTYHENVLPVNEDEVNPQYLAAEQDICVTYANDPCSVMSKDRQACLDHSMHPSFECEYNDEYQTCSIKPFSGFTCT